MSKKFLISLTEEEYKNLLDIMKLHESWQYSITGIKPGVSETQFAKQMLILGTQTLTDKLHII